MTLKTFLRLFICLTVIMASRSKNQKACVKFKKDINFPFNFIPESVKGDRTGWEMTVRKIANYTNYCLEKCLGIKRLCEKPLVKITFPLITGNPRIPLKVLPRPYLATRESSSGTARQVLSALGKIWKLFAFCLMAAAISGIMIWFLDHKANSGHFPKSFWSGTREGLWWAIVTMTTVGYGDKTPKSFLGRVYASLWMITGMLLMSYFTAQISSNITTDDLRPLDDKFGYNIGVPRGSKEFFEKSSEGAILKEYSTEEHLFRGLEDGEVDKIWLFDCKENGENPLFKIVHVLDSPAPVIGAKVKLLGEKKRSKVKKKFDQCLKNWTEEVQDDESILEQVASQILGEKHWKTKIPEQEKQRHCIEKHSRGRYHSDERTQSQMGFIDILLCTAAGLLIILFTTGALWDSCLKLRHARKPLDNNADIEKAVGAQELQSTTSILN